MSIEELKQKTETYLTEFYPERYVPKIIYSTQDIYKYKSLLKGINYNDFILGYLTDIILNDIAKKRRFRKYDCLKVIRAIVKSKGSNEIISKEVIFKLFKIYKEFINSENEEIQWCVSAIVKNSILSNEDIKWLVSHYHDSFHIINRLLRYPEKNSEVTAWAKHVYLNNEVSERISEIIGLLIDEDVPSFVVNRGNEIIWAIYYSVSPDKVKKNLLCKYLTLDTIEAALEVSSRLNYPSVVKYIYKELNKVSI